MKHSLLVIVCISFTSSVNIFADDWPMWRKNAGRTGVTATQIPASLQLSWVRHLPVLTPAYHSSRLQFDAGYEPIVADGQMLVASSRTDSVSAYELVTGKETWTFRTNGPIRCAPAVWRESVCFGSDDGHLYCVNLHTGQLRWKYRAVPSERRLLGNQRLISVWPVRGGPVISSGQVYFAAGVWPFEGVFVYAMDVDTGAVIWRNDRLGYLFGQQPHNTQAIGGLAPQGYLVVNGDDLIVPCSTAYPAVLNRLTGKLVKFELPGPGRFPGGWFAAIDETSALAIRRGKLTFDDVVNRQLHEDKVHKGHGVTGISRTIRASDRLFQFDDGLDGVDGRIHSMIAADNRLIVSTSEGRIYCFTSADAARPLSTRHWRQPVAPLSITEKSDTLARQLVQASAGPQGYAFVVGIQDGSLVRSLLRESKYHVVAIDDDHERINKLRQELDRAGIYGTRAALIESDPQHISLPPYIASMVTTETPERVAESWTTLLQTLRPFGGIAALETTAEQGTPDVETLQSLKPGSFKRLRHAGQTLIRRVGALPGATEYHGNWQPSTDELVRFPLGVLWFDDTLAHFKRSPQPQFTRGVMISRPKDWHAPRVKGDYSVDYPLLPPVLSDIYTGRVLDNAEQQDLRASLTETDPTKYEQSQYRPPRQKDAWKPSQPVVGERVNPLTGKQEPRVFPKTYGCDGGVDYGSFFTLRAGTPAFYDKTAESGTVFLSGPRSGCTNSVIPAGGVLNVPYFYEGCTCSYPLPTALSLVAMPESHEQWSAWGNSEPGPGSIERIGLNFGAPGDRITRNGTLWLDYPSVGGPSPKITINTSPDKPSFRYRHSVWMKTGGNWPWVAASVVEGLEQLTLHNLKPGRYTVRLFFSEPEDLKPHDRLQTVSLQGRVVLRDFDVIAQAGSPMREIVRQIDDVEVQDVLLLNLLATTGQSLISGLEVIRQR
ncbi:MAG: PQQ-binding-like beta-propeller repeat protein [Fuerstiella sp.]|nr:PQQ-binding-like beta-propeller repeat protein [Fuerstiella sp.]MCP4506916.1 PQQ-binding-like beta-propeller repeat protein [Fuerstiella sp.]